MPISMQWLYGTPSGRLVVAAVGAVFAISAGFYVRSHLLTCSNGHGCTVEAQGFNLKKSRKPAATRDKENDIRERITQAQDSKIEHLVGGPEAKGAENDTPRQNLETQENSLGRAEDLELRPEAIINGIEQMDRIENDRTISFNDAVTSLEATFMERQTDVVPWDEATAKAEDDEFPRQEEVKDSRSSINHQADEEFAALDSNFITDYGSLEDEVDDLRKENQALSGDTAHAKANVEGLKMQMETGEKTAEGGRVGIWQKLEANQAEINKLEDGRDSLQEDKDVPLKEIERLNEDRDALQQENYDLSKRVSSLEHQSVGLQHELSECCQRLALSTKEKTKLNDEIDGHSCRDGKDTGGEEPALEERDDRKQSQDDSCSLFHVVEEDRKTDQTTLVNRDVNGDQTPQSSALSDTSQSMSSSRSRDNKPKPKTSRLKKWSSRSKAVLSGLRGRRAPSNRQEH